jgi:hypothetical protein
MKTSAGAVLALAVIVGGLHVASSDAALPGSSVTTLEKSTVWGAVCYKDSVTNRWRCYGGENSDCTGCGCSWSKYPVAGGVFKAFPAVPCAANPICTLPFTQPVFCAPTT